MSIRRSVAWAYGAQAFTFVLTFGASVVVTRLLSTREVGVYAIAMAISAVLLIFTSFGVQSYLIRERDLTPSVIRSVYSVNAIMSTALAAGLVVAGLVQKYVFGAHDIALVLFVSSLTPLTGIWQCVPSALYQREMNYSLLSRVSIIGSMLSAVATIASAYGGLGSVSPVIGSLAAGVFTTVVLAYRRRGDFMAVPTFRGLRPIFAFGFQLMSVSGVAQLSQRMSDIVLGRSLGLSQLGIWSRAAGIGQLVFNNVYGSAAGLIFAKMSQDLRDTGVLHHTFVRGLKLITAAIWPLLIGIAILSRPIIYTLYGERWLEAAAPLAIIMVAQFVTLGFGMNWELFVLRGQTARQARFEAIRAVIGLALFTGGALFSIAWAAVGRLVETIISYFMYRPLMDGLAQTRKGELEAVYAESLLLTIAACAPVGALMLAFDWSERTPLPLIAAATATGIGLWLALVLYRRHPVAEELTVVMNKLRRRRGAQAADQIELPS